MKRFRGFLVVAAGLSLAWADAVPPKPADGAGSAAAVAAAAAPVPAAVKPATRPRMESSSQRNENVAVYLIDTNAVKEANIRIGTTPTAIGEPTADASFFATEHGRPAEGRYLLRPQRLAPSWHGEGFWSHQNSVFNARAFFQVGGVKPSHRNFYGGSFTGLLGKGWGLTGAFQQRAIRGMVNGNVLVPLPDERTPLTTNPEARAIVQSYLNAYPDEFPNRQQYDPRALNTNSPQTIDEINGNLRLDVPVSEKSRLFLTHSLQRQRIFAFQLVAGQNPNTEIHTTRSTATYQRTMDANTILTLGASFARVRSVLVSEPNAVGPRVRFGYQIEELGPDSMFPVDRATNTFRWGGAYQKILGGGRHTLSAGGDLTRFQLNGIESGNLRGYFQFTNNFGRSAIENLRLGTPSIYEIAIGDLNRGFRNWSLNGYVADRWVLHPKLQLYYGVHWTADTTPTEVDNKDKIPYACDCNNFSPRFALAWQTGRGWTARAMYTTTFSQILPVTYQQIRNNPPLVVYVQVQNPDLVDPLRGVDWSGPGARYTPTWLSPDLVAPYSHQYNLNLERRVWLGSLLRMGYVGSRTMKLLNSFIQNRADPVPGIPLTTATVDQRRADPRYYETRYVTNAGIAYFDGALVSWEMPQRRGFAGGISYVFSKAIDDGVDFSATAANKDILSQRSQSQYDALRDRRGPSNFHAPHSVAFNYAYDIPGLASANGWMKTLTSGWQVGGVAMWKSGTPFTLYVGSDAPGFGNVDGGPSDRPNLLDPSILGLTVGHPDVATSIISRERFSYIAPGQLAGNLGRNNFQKASIWNWNAAVTRLWRFRSAREYSAQVRAEVFNLTNTPQFDEPQRNYSSPSFGRITNTLNDGRVFQVGLRLIL